MGNTFCVARKAASKKQKILEFDVPVFANETLEKDELKRYLPANHELEKGCMYRTPPAPVQAMKIGPEAESFVASERSSCRIKLVMTKQQLRELVSKRISVQDIIELWRPNGGLMDRYWRPELESIPEEEEIGCFL